MTTQNDDEGDDDDVERLINKGFDNFYNII